MRLKPDSSENQCRIDIIGGKGGLGSDEIETYWVMADSLRLFVVEKVD